MEVVAGFPFVICDILQALSYLTSVSAGVVGFDLSPVLILCLSDGSLEGIGGFLIRVQVSDLLLEIVSSSL